MNEMFDAGRVKLTLETTVSSVLAEMAFMDCVPTICKNIPAPGHFNHCVVIDVLKPGSFRIELRVSEVLRSTILGLLFDPATLEPGGPEANEADLLLEILNVLAGNFISAYFGEAESPKLELPRYLYFKDQEEGTIVAESLMNAEGELLSVALRSVRYRY